jgi:formylglycine-generating enzyme required for sulfatase activity
MRRALLLVIVLFLLAAGGGHADAKRVALVVGINAYDNLKSDQQLRKAVNDARAISDTLKDVGFQVIIAEDATRTAFLRAWQRFLDTVKPGDVTTIFFAGHGIELNGANFLLPRDVPRPDDGEEVMRGSAIRVASLMERLGEQNPQVAIWIIDACRDNPYAGGRGTRSIGSTRGLKREEPPKGTLVMMSAGTGQSALDALSPNDNNPNSVYTRTLLPLLKEPGLEITDLAKRVRGEVETLATSIQFEQRPAFYHELSGNFFLVDPKPAPAAISNASGLSEAGQAWGAVKDTNNTALLRSYVKQFDGTFYAGLAQARLETLEKSGQAVVAAVPTAPPSSSARASETRVSPPPARPPTAMESAQAWLSVKDTTDPAALEAFLQRHGESIYASPARERVNAIRQQPSQLAAATRGDQSSPSPASPSAAQSERAWLAVKDAAMPDLLEEFLRNHGTSRYAADARAKLDQLAAERKRSQVAGVVQPATPPASPGAATPAVGVFPQARARALSAAQERMLKPGDTFEECEKCPQMVVVPAGSFTMGSPESETGRAANEGPERKVSIAKPFAAGKFAVTFEEWDACVAGGGCNGYTPADHGGRRGRHPVVNVSWDDAKAYVAWLSKTTGKTYRLLSEAEREFVTRAGTQTPFWFGATISSKQANYDGSIAYGSGEKGDYRRRVLPVDFFAPNAFGLLQVHGNVAEWTEDCWRGSYANAPTDGSARTVPECGGRTLRGGSFADGPDALRSAARSGFAPGNRAGGVGFRVARSL